MDSLPTDPLALAALPVLDESAVASLRDPGFGGDPEFLAEVVAAFFSDSPSRIEALRAGLSAGDSKAVALAAHSLKGSSGTFGAARMQTLCAEIERLIQAGQIEAIRPLAGQLEAEYAVLAAQLVKLVAEANASQHSAS